MSAIVSENRTKGILKRLRTYFDLSEEQSAVPTSPKFWGRMTGIGLVLAQLPTLVAPPEGQAGVNVPLVYNISIVVVFLGLAMFLMTWKGWTSRQQLILLATLMGIFLALSGYAYGPISGPLEMQFLPIAIGVIIGLTQPQFTSLLILPIVALDELSPVVTLHIKLSKFLNGAIMVMIGYVFAAELISWAVKLLRNAEERARESEKRAKESEIAAELARQEEILRSHTIQVLFDTSPDMIAMFDEEGNVLAASNVGREIFGDIEVEEGFNLLTSEMLHSDDREPLSLILKKLAHGKIEDARIRFRLLKKDWPDNENLIDSRKFITVESSLRPLYAVKGENAQIVSVSRDISYQVAMETELGKALEQAASASKAKSDFLARMSHELRTPLNAILGFGQLLERDELDDLQADSVSRILGAGRHLLNLINEVLDLAKVESGKSTVSVEEIELKGMILDVKALMTPLAVQHQISLNVIDSKALESATVFADIQKLKQIMINLVSNAIKYNTDEGLVNLRVTENDQYFRLEVEDSGNGIDESQFSKVFAPFERLGQESSHVEGTGIGLALCKELATAMGGDIGFTSVINKGSVFYVDLKKGSLKSVENTEFVDYSGPCFEDKRPLVSGNSTKHVLYVEDNESNVELMKRIFKSFESVELSTVKDGSLGWSILQESIFDLVLLDLHLPGLGGDEILCRIRKAEKLTSIPVVMVSASAMSSDIERLNGLGATDYLTKPIEVSKVEDLIEKYLF